jgi:tetratricopeptide (TPR) repeat protein
MFMKRILTNIPSKFKALGLVLFLVFLLAGCSDNEIDLRKTRDTTHHIDSLNKVIAEHGNSDIETVKQSDSLFKLSLALGYEKGIAESACQKIRLLRKDYQYDVALHFVTESMEYLHEIIDPGYQAMVNEEIGLLYMDIDDFKQAYNYLNLALTYYQKNNKLKKKSYILSRIGLMFKSNDVKKSKEYLQKSLDISIENNDSLGIARDLNNIAIIYQKQKIFDTAQVYYHQAMQINKEIGNWNYYATNLLNLANIEKQNENYEESIEIYSQLAFAFDSLNEKNKYALVLLHLGEAYLNINDYEKAINYFAIADSLGEKYSLTSIERNGNWGLYYCYNQLGENDLAIKYLQEQHKLDDIIRTKRNYQELTRLELHFRNDQLIKQKMWDQQKQKFILYFALALLLIFVAFLFQLFRKQKFKIAKEKLERKVLQNELEGKERELTSFVLNLIRLNEKKLGIITYLKKQRPRLKMENRDVIDTAIRDLEYDQDAQVWEEFEIRFNKVNSEFYQKLATSFPDLTLNEKRLCAFLLMNMTTKEIASITGQSTDAIGKARTRLRKKLGLTNQDESITSILDSL